MVTTLLHFMNLHSNSMTLIASITNYVLYLCKQTYYYKIIFVYIFALKSKNLTKSHLTTVLTIHNRFGEGTPKIITNT